MANQYLPNVGDDRVHSASERRDKSVKEVNLFNTNNEQDRVEALLESVKSVL